MSKRDLFEITTAVNGKGVFLANIVFLLHGRFSWRVKKEGA